MTDTEMQTRLDEAMAGGINLIRQLDAAQASLQAVEFALLGQPYAVDGLTPYAVSTLLPLAEQARRQRDEARTEAADQEKRANIHARLNERIATVLGLLEPRTDPETGEVYLPSWHDMPEQVANLKQLVSDFCKSSPALGGSR